MRVPSFGRTSVFLILLVAGPAAHANAQRVSRSPLGIRMKGRASARPDTTRTEPTQAPARVALRAPASVEAPSTAAKEKEARYSFNIAPTASAADSTWEVGAAVSFANKSLVRWAPFEVEVADAITSSESKTHNVLSLSATVQPIPDIPINGTSLSFYLYGSFQHTAATSDDLTGMGEIDLNLIDRDSLELTLSALGYYGHTDPSDGPATSGPTAGFSAYVKLNGSLTLFGEYDLRSDFAGEDTFLTKVSYDLPMRNRTTVTPFVTVAKHSQLGAGLTFNLAEKTKARPARLR